MSYVIRNGRVVFGASAVRGADARTFDRLIGDWARDSSCVYFEGRKVQRARRDHFVALSETFGADDKHVFYKNDGDTELTRSERRKELDYANLNFTKDGGLTFVRSGDVVMVTGRWGLIGPLRVEASSFVVLGRHYARDAYHVFWFGEDGRPHELADADPETFIVDEKGARDRTGCFVKNFRDAIVLPVELEKDVSAAVERRIVALFTKVLPRCERARGSA